MNTVALDLEYQIDLFRNQPDEYAVKFLQSYESMVTAKDPRGYCVCTSEGKDSRVVGSLMRRAGVKHFYLHNITGIDPPELVYFQRRNFQGYEDMGYETHDCRYDKSIWRLIQEKKIPPLRHMRYCCEHLKERRTPEQGDAMIATGVRKAESTRRAKSRSELEWKKSASAKTSEHLVPYDQDDDLLMMDSCFNNPKWQSGLFTFNPIAEWTDTMIWDYSKEAHLEQCSLYSEGFDRLGCIGCPMAGESGRRREFERYPAFKKLWIRAFDRLLLARKEAGLDLLDNAHSGKDWFEWWISDAAMEQPPDENQLFLDCESQEVDKQ